MNAHERMLSWDNHKRNCPNHRGKWHYTALLNGSWLCANSIKEKRALDLAQAVGKRLDEALKGERLI